jgi:hypothetical protein
MLMRRCYAASGLLVSTAFFSLTAYANAQSRSLTRNFEPVVIAGSSFADFYGVTVGSQNTDLFLYAYRQNTQAWEPIPFQFDEKDTSGNYFNPNGDQVAGLDENDELVFMARDAGDRADSDTWIEDADSRTFVRYEIEVTDPLVGGGKAWAYLYRSTTLDFDPNLTDYVDYFASTTANAGEDAVHALFYQVAHSTNGFPKDLKITAAGGGNDQDLLDILKFRASVSNTNITENNISLKQSQSDKVDHKEGLIRVIRKLDATFTLFSIFDLNFSPPPFFYYPYSATIDIEIPVPEGLSITIEEGRMSFDLNENAANPNSTMKFVSANNPEPGFFVDGVSDNPEIEIDSVLPDSNWIHITGAQGTIVHLFPLSKSVGGKRQLYYKDNSTIDNSDTGDDKKSFGDTGIEISEGIEPPVTISYRGYFLAANTPSTIGSQIAEFVRNPFTVNTNSQLIVSVELTAFTISVDRNNVLLNWQTAREVNNRGFEIERRLRGSAWNTIAVVKSNEIGTSPGNYTYVDRNLSTGDYDYRLKILDLSGSFEYSGVVQAVVGLPETFALLQNFPNPFNPSTEIQYQLPVVGGIAPVKNRTILKIYNLLGEEIRTLIDKEEAPGFYSTTWDGKDKSGRTAPSGIYIYRLQFGPFVETRKMAFVQ